jgi:hypothetical protein
MDAGVRVNIIDEAHAACSMVRPYHAPLVRTSGAYWTSTSVRVADHPLGIQRSTENYSKPSSFNLLLKS